jgi:hypothetical protein
VATRCAATHTFGVGVRQESQISCRLNARTTELHVKGQRNRRCQPVRAAIHPRTDRSCCGLGLWLGSGSGVWLGDTITFRRRVPQRRGFDESCCGVHPGADSPGVPRGFVPSRAPVRGQSPNVESRLSAVQPAIAHAPSSMISPRIANATTRITSSPRRRVASAGTSYALNDAGEIGSTLGLAPVRHRPSRLPTVGNRGPGQRVAFRRYDRKGARTR